MQRQTMASIATSILSQSGFTVDQGGAAILKPTSQYNSVKHNHNDTRANKDKNVHIKNSVDTEGTKEPEKELSSQQPKTQEPVLQQSQHEPVSKKPDLPTSAPILAEINSMSKNELIGAIAKYQVMIDSLSHQQHTRKRHSMKFASHASNHYLPMKKNNTT